MRYAPSSAISLSKCQRRFRMSADALTVLATSAAWSDTVNFDTQTAGLAPAECSCGVTGSGKPVWQVETDTTAPSAPNVLKQSGTGTFPWCVRQGTNIVDGFVEVRFKALSGREDQ